MSNINVKKPELGEADKRKLEAKITRVLQLTEHEGFKDFIEYLDKLDNAYIENLTGAHLPKPGASMDFFVGYNRGAISYGRDARGFFNFYRNLHIRKVNEHERKPDKRSGKK